MRFFYGVSALFVAWSVAPAQQAADREAYRQAVLRPDAQARVEALRQFLTQYPKSGRAASAQELILKTLVQNWPEGAVEIQRQVKAMTSGVAEADKPEKFDTVADVLVSNGASQKGLLETALKVEAQAIRHFDDKKLLARMKRQNAGAKAAVTDAMLQRYVDEVHADLLTTMGRIELALGSTAKAQPLLAQAHKLDAENSGAPAALGEIAFAEGHEAEALDLLANAQLCGALTPTQRKHLLALFAKLHGTEAGGIEAWLDRVYLKRSPETIRVEPYQPAAASGKTVLAELFTGAGCGPCAGADVAMDAAMERFGKRDLAVLMYHEHIPEPDPMANPAAVKRFSYYGLSGTPTLVVDGETIPAGGGARADGATLYERFVPKIETELKAGGTVPLSVQVSREGERVMVQARLEAPVPDSGKLRLQIVLAEKLLRYSGENGIRFHPMVVRAVGGPEQDGYAVLGAGSTVYEATFDTLRIGSELKSYLDGYEAVNDRFGPIHFSEKKDSIDPVNLAVVVFVQDAESKHVLQSSYAEPDAR